MAAEEPDYRSELEVSKGTTPKIIWAIWLTFGEKTDGILTDVLEFCINRIYSVYRFLNKLPDFLLFNLIYFKKSPKC